VVHLGKQTGKRGQRGVRRRGDRAGGGIDNHGQHVRRQVGTATGGPVTSGPVTGGAVAGGPVTGETVVSGPVTGGIAAGGRGAPGQGLIGSCAVRNGGLG
jgi:hypothetical protein